MMMDGAVATAEKLAAIVPVIDASEGADKITQKVKERAVADIDK